MDTTTLPSSIAGRHISPATHYAKEEAMPPRMRTGSRTAILSIAMTLCFFVCLAANAPAQEFYEDWESGLWGDWQFTGTQDMPPSGWSFEAGYNSTYSAEAKHYHSFGGWGGSTGLYHAVDMPATSLDLYYYFDSSGSLDYASQRVILHLSDDKQVQYWLDTYDCEIPESTDEIKYIDCTGTTPATWHNLHRDIVADIAGFSGGQVIGVEYGASSRGNGGGAFYGLMRADNILLQAEPDLVPPTVELLVPNGGEIWLAGTVHEICWADSDDVGIVGDSLYYSVDGGTQWLPITYQDGDPESYSWTVPNTPSDDCKVRITVFDWGDNSASDDSDACFSIVPDTTPPSVTVTSPNGGENWGSYEWQTITWTAEDNVGVVADSVFYSINGGADWIFVAAHTGNPQSHAWQVPDTPSGHCLVTVKVFDAAGESAEDVSDATFTIYEQVPPPVTYAVVVKNSTYLDPEWQLVVETLLQRHGGMVFTFETNVWEIQAELGAYHPSHVGFVTEPLDASQSFVNTAHQFMRALDEDPYADAIWGVITGYNAGDALRVASGPPSMTISNVIFNDCGSLLNYVSRGTYFACHIYNFMVVKHEDGHMDTLVGPTDCVDTLVAMVNSNDIDLFMTAGHGSHDQWQRHYPESGYEGFFRSSAGQVYGDPYTGPNTNINSTNPKIIFNPYSCLVGKIVNMNSLVPAWFHTGGAYQYAGYLVTIGYCYNGKGVHEYLWNEQDKFSYAEACYLSNQALLFDQINGTPGVDQGNLSYERDQFAFYGDPASEARLRPVKVPFYSETFAVSPGPGDCDTVTCRITINRAGHPWNYGGNPAFAFPPFDVADPEVIYTDAHNAVVTEEFVLLNIWNNGDPDFEPGDTREVVFTCGHVAGAPDDPITADGLIPGVRLCQNYPNPFRPRTTIAYTLPRAANVALRVYDVRGRVLWTLTDEFQQAGRHSIVWDARDVSSGIYFYRITAGGLEQSRKCMILK
jgi:zinc protease